MMASHGAGEQRTCAAGPQARECNLQLAEYVRS